jgi:hypothetical protein
LPIASIEKTAIKRIIDNVRDEIGRNVTFYTENLAGCSLCVASGYYDPIGDTTYYTVCPICSGSYWINTSIATEVLARVHWVNDEAITATPGGKYYIGEATLTVDPIYLNLAEACEKESGKIVVDGHNMAITKIIPMGAPEINRYRIILKNMGDRPA